MLLKQIESEPTQWRAVALAFIEEQAFRDSVRTVNTSLELVSITDERISPSVSVAAAIPETANQGSLNSRRDGNNLWFLAATMAATVLLVIGVSISRNESSVDSIQGSNRNDQVALQELKPSVTTSETDSDLWGKPIGELTFASDDSAAQTPKGVLQAEVPQSLSTNPRIPIYEVRADQAKRWIDEESQRTKTWREQLRRQGYELDTRPQRIEKQLPDGRALIIPVNKWNIRPYGQ